MMLELDKRTVLMYNFRMAKRTDRNKVRVDRIGSLMQSTGLDSLALAYHSGISYDYVYKILRGDRPNMSAENLAAIATTLGTSMEYLMGITDDSALTAVPSNPGLSEKDNAWLVDKSLELAMIVRQSNELSEKEKEVMLTYADGWIRQLHKMVDDVVAMQRSLATAIKTLQNEKPEGSGD